MKAYRILVHDTRFGQPQELAAEMAHDARAIEYAYDRLAANDHMASIEVWRDAVKLCSYSRELRRAA